MQETKPRAPASGLQSQECKTWKPIPGLQSQESNPRNPKQGLQTYESKLMHSNPVAQTQASSTGTCTELVWRSVDTKHTQTPRRRRPTEPLHIKHNASCGSFMHRLSRCYTSSSYLPFDFAFSAQSLLSWEWWPSSHFSAGRHSLVRLRFQLHASFPSLLWRWRGVTRSGQGDESL